MCVCVCVSIYQLLYSDMNRTVTEVILGACLQPVLLGDKFAMEHMMVVTLLHNDVGTDVGTSL